jgi:hypothetical protein
MLHPTRRGRGKRVASSLAVAAASLLVLAGAALAAVGLQNPSFESGLDGWTAEIIRAGDHEPTPVDDCEEPDHDPQRAICVVGSETFTAAGHDANGDARSTTATVTPLNGTTMVRLGGPFTSDDELQPQDRYRLSQTFTVDPANPVLNLNYNVFLFDNQAIDELRFRLTDEGGATIADFAQRGVGVADDETLKTTGWRSASIDLTGYEDQQVHLTIASGGNNDDFYGFWAYLDAGAAPAPPVSPPSFKPPTNPVSGEQVPLNVFSNPVTGEVFLAASPSQADAFPGDCMPVDVDLSIDGGAGAVSDVNLLSSFAQPIWMTEVSSPGVWRGQITCVRSGDLAVQYVVTEDHEEQTFIVPLGGIALVDPAGVVYDQRRYDAAVATGTPADQARAAAAIEGATVRLQREVGGSFKNVLSGDPGISPHVNPETSGANGQFQWLADAGSYRVVVSKPGYDQAVSRAVTNLADLHVGLVPTSSPPPPGDTGGGAPNTGGGGPAVVTRPPATTTRKPACAGLRGSKLAKCRRAQTLAKAIATCKKGKASKRALCIKRAKALSKCDAMTGRKNVAKRKRCIAKARRIGTKP